MVLPQGGGSTFVSGGEYSPPTGWLDKPLLVQLAAYDLLAIKSTTN